MLGQDLKCIIHTWKWNQTKWPKIFSRTGGFRDFSIWRKSYNLFKCLLDVEKGHLIITRTKQDVQHWRKIFKHKKRLRFQLWKKFIWITLREPFIIFYKMRWITKFDLNINSTVEKQGDCKNSSCQKCTI